jgi:hypothetical protein
VLRKDSFMESCFAPGASAFEALSEARRAEVIGSILAAGRKVEDNGGTPAQCRFACYKAWTPSMGLTARRGVRHRLHPVVQTAVNSAFGESKTGFKSC